MNDRKEQRAWLADRVRSAEASAKRRRARVDDARNARSREHFIAVAESMEYEAAVLRAILETFDSAGGWISVEDRLPAVAVRVLATDGVVVSVGQWAGEWRVWAGFEEVRNITHWQPLPEAPE